MKTQDKVGDFNDFYPFREGVGDMIDILGLDIYNILWKNCGFSKNNDDKIDINIVKTPTNNIVPNADAKAQSSELFI